MKTKSISFAEVLRKNARSPKSEATQGLRLSELVQQFQMNPREDYTLYLGKCNTSQRSKPAKMGYSRNTPDSLVFDSWIQKQSSLGPNKENIRSQRTSPHEHKKSDVGFRKLGFQSRTRQQWQPAANSKTSQRHMECEPLEESQQNYPQLHIEMIKSNGYEAEAVGKVKYPQVQKGFRQEQVKQKKAPFQLRTEPTFKELKEAEQQLANYLKSNENFNDFTSFPRQQPNQSFQSKRVEEDLNEISNKYMNKYESDGEVQEEELLLAQSNDRAQEVVYKEEETKKVDKNDEILKRRLDEAKNILGNYFDKIKKGKQEETQKEVVTHAPNHHVGYSFSSSNFLNQHAPNQPTNIQEPVVEEPQVEQALRDSDFRNKYLNLQSFEEPSSIKNIESVKYEGSKIQEEKAYEVPSDSFKVKLISSNDKQSGDCIQAVQHTYQVVFSPKEQPRVPTIYTETNQSIQDNTKPSKSRQKISLISSRSKSKSNKSSPTAVQQTPAETPQTTDFTLGERIVEKKESIQIPTKTENASPILAQNKAPAINAPKQSGYSAFIAEKKIQLSSQYTAPAYAQATSMYSIPKLPNYSGKSYAKFNETYYATVNPIETPSYATYATKPALVTSKISQNAPLKVDTPYSVVQKQENKKRVSFAEAAEVYEERSDKEPKRNYLSRLDIKESITMEDPKSKIQVTFSKNNYGLGSREYKTTIIPASNPLKQSLKESINLSESGQFAFDL